MKVSVIIPVYNASSYLDETIKSVVNQTYNDWELLLIDDCSTDSTVDIAEKWQIKDARIKLIRLLKNGGAAVARNKGIALAQGEFIAFLDSDDRWHPEKLQKQIAFMEDNRIAFSYTNYYIVDDKGERPFDALLDKVTYPDIIKFNYIACSLVIYNRKQLGKCYMPLIRNRQDWGLWIDLIRKCGEAHLLKEYLMYYTIREDSISNNKFRMLQFHWFIYYRHLNFNLIKATFFFVRNVYWHMKNKRR